MRLKNGYDKGKTSAEYRPMTRAEVLALRCGDHPNAIDRHGMVRVIKINGAVRTWKRDADRVEVPWKYGMYEYGVFDLTEALNTFVVRIGD